MDSIARPEEDQHHAGGSWLRRPLMLAMVGFAGLFGWRLFRRMRAEHPGATLEELSEATAAAFPQAEESGPKSAARRALRHAGPALAESASIAVRGTLSTAAMGIELAQTALDGLADRRSGGGAVTFEWTVRASDPEVVHEVLRRSRVTVQEQHGDGHADNPSIEQALEALGIQLDQGSSGGHVPPVGTTFGGTVSTRRLVRALEAARQHAQLGLIVDTAYSVVQIDEHPEVARGAVALIDNDRARLIGARAERPLREALEAVAARAREGVPAPAA